MITCILVKLINKDDSIDEKESIITLSGGEVIFEADDDKVGKITVIRKSGLIMEGAFRSITPIENIKQQLRLGLH